MSASYHNKAKRSRKAIKLADAEAGNIWNNIKRGKAPRLTTIEQRGQYVDRSGKPTGNTFPVVRTVFSLAAILFAKGLQKRA